MLQNGHCHKSMECYIYYEVCPCLQYIVAKVLSPLSIRIQSMVLLDVIHEDMYGEDTWML